MFGELEEKLTGTFMKKKFGFGGWNFELQLDKNSYTEMSILKSNFSDSFGKGRSRCEGTKRVWKWQKVIERESSNEAVCEAWEDRDRNRKLWHSDANTSELLAIRRKFADHELVSHRASFSDQQVTSSWV